MLRAGHTQLVFSGDACIQLISLHTWMQSKAPHKQAKGGLARLYDVIC